mmetsp:Transcript_163/g.286  ORF Transcript_163/g.286 Transcript_163/m.286 type:complete len:83 (-) Transcript_163:17-265(-)
MPCLESTSETSLFVIYDKPRLAPCAEQPLAVQSWSSPSAEGKQASRSQSSQACVRHAPSESFTNLTLQHLFSSWFQLQKSLA